MKKVLACVVLALSLAGLPTASAQGASDLFQQGLRKERVDGDLKSAIAIYRRLVQEYPTDRPLVARALIQLGGAYERMGNADARAAYVRVVRDYPEQSTEASLARTRLAALSGGARTVVRTEPTVRRMWAGPTVDVLGSPTQDGRMVTFVDWSTGDLAIHDFVTGENRRLTSKGSWTSSVAFANSSVPSPDGKAVAYDWYPGGKDTVEVRIIGINSGGSRVIFSSTRIGYLHPWEWALDGSRVLTSIHSKDGTNQIVLLGVADSSVRILKALGTGEPSKIALSPDGRFLAFDYPVSGAAQEHDVYVMRVDGGAQTAVVSHPAQDLLMGWTPDGNGIVFASDRTGNMSLWMLPIAKGIAAGEPELLRRDAEFTMTPMAITRDGRFYYSVNASPTDLFVADVDASTGKVVGQPKRLLDRYVGENRNADWSPDGSSVVYISKRQPGPGASTRILVIRSLTDGRERIIPTKLSLRGQSAPHFWPDGNSIVVRGADAGGRTGLFLVALMTGESKFLMKAPAGQYAGVIDGGRAIIFLHRDFQRGTATLVRHNLPDSSLTEIYGYTDNRNLNLFAPTMSSDGKSAAFVYIVVDSLAGSIRVVPTSGGQPRQIAAAAPGFEFRNLAWSADGRHIYYTQNRVTSDGRGGFVSETDHMPIMRVPVAGGTPEETGIFGDEIEALHLSPDGKRISYTAGRNAMEIWMMENFLPKPAKRAAISR